MGQERLMEAIARIDAALARIEAGAERAAAGAPVMAAPAAAADPVFEARYARLRAAAGDAVARIDRLIEGETRSEAPGVPEPQADVLRPAVGQEVA